MVELFPHCKSVYLSERLGLAIVAQSFREGFLRLVSPETEAEALQLGHFRDDLLKAPSPRAALLYALLFDEVLVDNSCIDHNVLFSSLEEADIDSASIRSLVDLERSTIPPFTFVDVLGTTTPIRTALIDGRFGGRDFANEMALLEPLIWTIVAQSSRISNPLPERRELLRAALWDAVLTPELLEILAQNRSRPKHAVRLAARQNERIAMLVDFWELEHLVNMFQLLLMAGVRAIPQAIVAARHRAVLATPSLSVGRAMDVGQAKSARVRTLRSDSIR